jgi:hypothetical protein
VNIKEAIARLGEEQICWDKRIACGWIFPVLGLQRAQIVGVRVPPGATYEEAVEIGSDAVYTRFMLLRRGAVN